jgi:cation transport ATPase
MCVLMLTNDHSITIERLTKSLGIDEVKSRLKLEDTFNQVKHSS